MEKEDRPLWLVLAGIAIFSVWYIVSRRTENALWLILAALCVLALAFRLYGAFLTTRAAIAASDEQDTPARLPTERWVLVLYQFASTAGIGVVLGPVLAMQFGYLPGLLWLLVAAALAGGVHDVVVLLASRRRAGAFLPSLVAQELGSWAGLFTWIIVLLALLLFLAALGGLLADILVGNVWALYVLSITVVAAILAGAYDTWLRPGRLGEAVAIGGLVVTVGVALGSGWAMRPAASGLLANRSFIVLLLAAYCVVSSLLPLRALGRPRGALSGYIMLLALVGLAAGIALAAPALRQPATTRFMTGGGPLLPAGVVPYLAIVLTAGAISGFNALVSSGVSSRMLHRAADAAPVGYGALLLQTLLVVLVLVSLSALWPGDFYAINTSINLDQIESRTGFPLREWDNLRSTLRVENLRQPGGVAAIAAGGAWSLQGLPGLKRTALPTLYRLMTVLLAVILFAGLEGAALAGRAAMDDLAGAALRTPPLARLSGNRRAPFALSAAGVLALTVLWLFFALRADALAVVFFFGFVALLLAAIGMGTGAASLARQGRLEAPLLVALGAPLAALALLATLAGLVIVRDSARYIDMEQAASRAWSEIAVSGPAAKIISQDRARDMLNRWQPQDFGKLYALRGQSGAVGAYTQRVGGSAEEAQRMLRLLGGRINGLRLWSAFQALATALLLLLGFGVAVGRLIPVSLRWPTARRAGSAQPSQGEERRSAHTQEEPVDGVEYEI